MFIDAVILIIYALHNEYYTILLYFFILVKTLEVIFELNTLN